MSAIITPEQLNGIESRCNAATPGPWEMVQDAPQVDPDNYRVSAGPFGWVDGAYMSVSGPIGSANADFIAAARSDIPALIAEVKRLRKMAVHDAYINACSAEGGAWRQGKPKDDIEKCRESTEKAWEAIESARRAVESEGGGMNSNEGWTWLHNSRKWHYFRNGMSLCGKFALMVKPQEGFGGDTDSPDDCKACMRRRTKERRAGEEA